MAIIFSIEEMSDELVNLALVSQLEFLLLFLQVEVFRKKART